MKISILPTAMKRVVEVGSVCKEKNRIDIISFFTSMKQHIAHISIVVDDYDRAIQFYTKQLGFVLVEDTMLSETKRWVIVAPPGSNGCSLLLARAANPVQESRIGNQAGGRVFLFLHTDNFERDYKRMKEKGISFVRDPVKESWGTVAVFEDLYGNLWDFIQPLKQEQKDR